MAVVRSGAGGAFPSLIEPPGGLAGLTGGGSTVFRVIFFSLGPALLTRDTRLACACEASTLFEGVWPSRALRIILTLPRFELALLLRGAWSLAGALEDGRGGSAAAAAGGDAGASLALGGLLLPEAEAETEAGVLWAGAARATSTFFSTRALVAFFFPNMSATTSAGASSLVTAALSSTTGVFARTALVGDFLCGVGSGEAGFCMN